MHMSELKRSFYLREHLNVFMLMLFFKLMLPVLQYIRLVIFLIFPFSYGVRGL